MAKILLRVNQNGLEPFSVEETAVEVMKALRTADKEGGLAKFERDGGPLYINPDFVAYVLPSNDEAVAVIAEDVTA